ALDLPLKDLSFDDIEISLSRGPLGIYDYRSLLEFNQLTCRLGLRAATTDRVLEEQARRARKLQGDKLGLEDFAQFLNLPVTDTLKEVHSFFDEHGDGQIDVRRYVIALSTVRRPTKSMETLKLAFKVSFYTAYSGLTYTDQQLTFFSCPIKEPFYFYHKTTHLHKIATFSPISNDLE
uniref:EF-hand domain-containing protein n=1 Tax=Pundamilia nyererei TaxID=303518 RepID=A0A3B4FWW8_9CICH